MFINKVVSTLAWCMSLFLRANAQQDSMGFSTRNYTGISSVVFHSVNIANNHNRRDVNISGVNAKISSDQAKFKLNDLEKSLDGDKRTDQLFRNNADYISALANFAIHLPSIIFCAEPEKAFVFTNIKGYQVLRSTMPV